LQKNPNIIIKQIKNYKILKKIFSSLDKLNNYLILPNIEVEYERELPILGETTIFEIIKHAQIEALKLEKTSALIWSGFIYGLNLPDLPKITIIPKEYEGESQELHKAIYEKEYQKAIRTRRKELLSPGSKIITLVYASALAYAAYAFIKDILYYFEPLGD